MKNGIYKLIAVLCLSGSVYSQVGINTTTPDPTGVLDVNGEITVRDQPNLTVTANTMNVVVDTTGYGVNNGKVKLIPLNTSSTPLYNDIIVVKMPTSVQRGIIGIQGQVFIDNINLNLSQTVLLSPSSTYKITVTGKVPSYQVCDANLDVASYTGIQLERNGIILEDWSVKQRTTYNQEATVPVSSYPNRTHPLYLEYKEIVTGESAITYEIVGLVQHHGMEQSFSTVNYYFGQGTNGSGPFFGEGVGMMVIEIEEL